MEDIGFCKIKTDVKKSTGHFLNKLEKEATKHLDLLYYHKHIKHDVIVDSRFKVLYYNIPLHSVHLSKAKTFDEN